MKARFQKSFGAPGTAVVTIFFALAFTASLTRAQSTGFTHDSSGNLNSIASAASVAPAILASPASQVFSADGSATFFVVASGTGTLTYQWLSNGVPISGAMGDSLTITNVLSPRSVVSNGGFELPEVSLSFVTYAAPLHFRGWNVETGSVDQVFSAWVSAEAFQSMDLNGGSAGAAIYQDVPTSPGQQYVLRYALAGNPAAGPLNKTNAVWWDGALLATNIFNITGHAYDDLGWTNYEYTVTATTSLTRLKFASLNSGAAGPALDEVSLIPIQPAPAQYSVIVSNASGSVTSAVATIEFDTDRNGLPDAWERTYFSIIGQSPTADSDSDGVSNLDEFREGTNPTNSASLRPRLNVTAWPGGAVGVQAMQPSYALNENVQLTAQALIGVTFVSWTGGITNTNPIVNVVMNSTRSLNAIFGFNLINGTNADGTIENGGTNTYAFTANAGDTIVLRCGELSGSALFAPWLRLYGPGCVLVSSASQATDAYLAYRATNSGVFSVTVTSTGSGQDGNYRLRLLRIPGAFIVPAGDEGGALTNGASYSATNDLGDEDIWTFTANAGDSFVLRCAKPSGGANYSPWMRVYGPDGAFLMHDADATDSFLSYRATNSGAFSVVVGSYIAGYTGSYRLTLAQMPGAFVVPTGDEGGALVSGGNYDGTNVLGDEDLWSFTANAGDSVVVRCGELSGTVSYYPWIRLYGPNGALLAQDNNVNDALFSYRTTTGGTFTVLVSSAFAGHSGSYRLRFMQIPGTPIIPAGDDGGPMTNGGNHDGTNDLGDEDIWTFTANSGDSIVLRCGELSGTASYGPWIRLYGSNGALLVENYHISDAYLSYRATNSGTFSVLVGSGILGHTGSYRLRLMKMPGAFTVPPGDDGGALANGANHDGTTSLGDEDLWTFTANAGENVVLRCGELSGTASYTPWIRVYGANGALLAQNDHFSDAWILYQTTNAGTFSVLVGSSIQGHTGTYRLRLAQVPGAFTVPPDDEGGPLVNGAAHDGVTLLGDEDLWMVTADAGDTLVFRCADASGVGGFAPYLRLYGPNGALLDGDANELDSFVSFRATNSGTFTVMVDSYYQAYAGNYRLRLAQIPGAFVVPSGDEGGPLAPGITNFATIDLADEDIWQFTAFKNVPISVSCQRISATFVPWIRLYGPTGILLASVSSATTATINNTPTNTGTFTVLLGSLNRGQTGTYRIYGNGFTEGLKLGTPSLSGANLLIPLTGGYSNLQFIATWATNLSPPIQWSAFLTNQFDAAGNFILTNSYNPAQPQQYFRFHLP